MTGSLPGPAPEERPQPAARRNAQGIRVDPRVEAEREPRRTVISALVAHEPGVLAQVSGLFRRRQFNIESLTVGPTEDPDHARITMVVEEPDPGIAQVERQLEKLLCVVSVRELPADAVRRELAVLKVNGDAPDRVHAITEMYGGQTLDAGPRTITVEITGDERTIDDAIDAYAQFGVRELVRTGQAALARGEEPTAPPDDRRGRTGDAGRTDGAGDAGRVARRTDGAGDATPADGADRTESRPGGAGGPGDGTGDGTGGGTDSEERP